MALSKDDCYQCVAECMMDSLTDTRWKTARMDVELNGREISVRYAYTSGLFNKQTAFKTSNVFAPPNAMKALRDMMAAEGEPWSRASFSLKPDGSFQFEHSA